METAKTEIDVSVTHVELIQQMTEEFAASTSEVERLLIDIYVKITALVD